MKVQKTNGASLANKASAPGTNGVPEKPNTASSENAASSPAGTAAATKNTTMFNGQPKKPNGSR